VFPLREACTIFTLSSSKLTATVFAKKLLLAFQLRTIVTQLISKFYNHSNIAKPISIYNRKGNLDLQFLSGLF
jgi:hypothetical protein